MVLSASSRFREILFLATFCLCVTMTVSACDANFVSAEILSVSSNRLSALLFVPLFFHLSEITHDHLFPQAWESLELDANSGTVQRMLDLAFLSGFLAFVKTFLHPGAQSRGNMGRLTFELTPASLTLSQNALATGSYRMLIGTIGIAGRARTVWYGNEGKIDFIDELPLETNLQWISVWPPVLPPHFKGWGRNWHFDWSLRGEHGE